MFLDGIHHLAWFVTAGLLLNLTPGADMALIAQRAASGGWRPGAAAALGVGAGCFVHIAAGALGLSALLASSPMGFTLLRWAGAAYLVWLGIGLWRAGGRTVVQHAGPTPGTAAAAAATAARLFAQGFLTNALNPKVALFFLAFVPQFIAPQATHKAGAFVLLGLVFVVNGTLVNLGVAAVAAALARRLAGAPRWQVLGRWLNRGVGALFVGLGLKLALDGSR
jgi:threonine/homoserine/homoserine lactone efflux protein